MKKSVLQILLLSILCLFTACNSKDTETQFAAKPIVKTVGKIDVMVDPNVEMMMILGRLSGASPYNFDNNLLKSPYIDDVDSYFLPYKDEPAVNMSRKNNMNYGVFPEFGMYMNKDNSGFIMDINNKNFISANYNLPAKKITFYIDNQYINEIRNFRQKSNFDTFFINQKHIYEEQINQIEQILSKDNFSDWLEEFYGIKIKGKINLHVTYLTGGGNFGLSIRDSKGKETLNSVIAAVRNEESFLYLISHEFSHPLTFGVVEKLYSNEKISSKFDKLYYKYSHVYLQNGYNSGMNVLNETINQACANKYIEKVFPESVMKAYSEWEISENRKMIYVPAIAEFLDNYQNNRKKYKTLEDFIPELEAFILTLE